MARPLKPFIRGGGYYPSRKWTPLVYNSGYTTMNGGDEPEDPNDSDEPEESEETEGE